MKQLRDNTPKRLRIDPKSTINRTLGVGNNGIVKTLITPNGDEVAVKIPLDQSKNIKQEFEFFLKKSISELISEKFFMKEVNVLPALSMTISEKLFSTTDNPKVPVFTMPVMDGTLAELSEDEKSQNRQIIKKMISCLHEYGFVMHDMKNENIFMKDGKPCIGDCGECRIKSNTKAQEIFNRIVQEHSYDPKKYSDFIEQDLGAFFL